MSKFFSFNYMRIFLLFYVLLFFSNNLNGQIEYDKFKDWDEIHIVDAYGGWSFFNNEFKIEKKSLALLDINSNDTIIKRVDERSINKLLNSLTTNKEVINDPLKIFGKDSSWFLANADSIWLNYRSQKGLSNIFDSVALIRIKDYKIVKNVAWRLRHKSWTDDYPYTRVSIVKGGDTLSIYSIGQYPYMMPWNVGGVPVYNSNIPIVIGNLLPDSISSNKNRLLGKDFNYFLIDKIYNWYIKDDMELLEIKNKFPKKMKKLSEHFQITYADLSIMSSIEWGGFMGGSCLELVLNDSTVSKDIFFSTILGRRLYLRSVNPIIKKKRKIIELIEDNPVYKYCINSDSVRGEIHFVNRRSLSNEAKRAFLRDVKESGQKKSSYRYKFKNCIFFELNEVRNSQSSFSRWLFFQDGSIVLWQLKGDFLMESPQKYISKSGYVCINIDRNSFDK